MANFIGILTLCLSIFQLHAQNTPNGMLYQAVARDASGNLAVKRTIYVQTTILKGSATGTVMYSDEHKVISNADAMFTVVVGQGKFLTGVYSKLIEIPWGSDKYFFNVKMCVAPSLPGTGWKMIYSDMGTSQFWSVPYSLFSAKSADSLALNINGTQRQLKLGSYTPIAFSVADDDSVSNNEIQQISRIGDTLYLSRGGGYVIITDNDKQQLNLSPSKGSISLTNGGSIQLPDSSSTNELQSLSLSNDTLFISKGNSIKLGFSQSGTSGTNFNTRLGFASSTTWTCPAGVTKITVELWGASGGGGGGSYARYMGGIEYGCKGSLNIYSGGNGGIGGSGGYNRAVLTVTPGTTYNISIGLAGAGGFGGDHVYLKAGVGSAGGKTSFSNLLSADGGAGGVGGESKGGTCSGCGSCINGVAGTNGTVSNYSVSNVVYVQGIGSQRSFIPIGYVSGQVYAQSSAPGGAGGAGGATGSGIQFGSAGKQGEDGYCVIMY
jgi:hypothetical protein